MNNHVIVTAPQPFKKDLKQITTLLTQNGYNWRIEKTRTGMYYVVRKAKDDDPEIIKTNKLLL